MSSIPGKFQQVAQEYHLTFQDTQILERCVINYSSSSFLAQIVSRAINAVKAIFGQSDWQKAKYVLRTYMKKELRDTIHDEENTRRTTLAAPVVKAVVRLKARERSEEVLKDLVSCNLYQNLVSSGSVGGRTTLMSALFAPNKFGQTIDSKEIWMKHSIVKVFSQPSV